MSICMIKLINVLTCTIAAVIIFISVCQLDITTGYEPRRCVTLALFDKVNLLVWYVKESLAQTVNQLRKCLEYPRSLTTQMSGLSTLEYQVTWCREKSSWWIMRSLTSLKRWAWGWPYGRGMWERRYSVHNGTSEWQVKGSDYEGCSVYA